jgi:hypothetical protein
MEEVGVVYEDLDWFFGTEKKVPPIGQSKYKSEEFAIPDIVVSFCTVKGFGCVSNGMSFPSFVFLE